MTHPSPLELSMYADNGLTAEAAAVVAGHVADCPICRASVAELQNESEHLAQAMHHEALELQTNADRIVVPKFSRPTGLREFALANVLTALVIWLAQFLWKTLFGELVMNAATWANSIYAPDIYDLTVATTVYYLQEGTAMLDAYFGFVVLVLSVLTIASLVLFYRKSQAVMSLCLVVLTGGAIVVPESASALDVRWDENLVTVAEDEVIDDTLIVAADTVVVKGAVTGNLVAVGRQVTVEGDVGGDVISFGESVTVRGSVQGLVLGAGASFELLGAAVGSDVWISGERVSVDQASSVGKNVVMAGQSASVEGSVGKDYYAFAESVELNGPLSGNLEVFSNRVRLLDSAHVQGDAILRVRNEDALVRADGARIDGRVEFKALPEDFEEENPYATVEFYMWQVARLVMALLAGMALFWLVPGLRNVSLGGGLEGIKVAGLGLVALVSLPIVAVIIALTLVGLPFSFLAVVSWIALIYLAKIVIGGFIGQRLLGNGEHENNVVLVLLVGMAVVIVAINLPFLGGVISFVFTIIGIGLLLQYLFAVLGRRNPGHHET